MVVLRSSLRGSATARRHRLELLLQLVRLDLADELAIGVEEDGRGPVGHAEGLLDLAVGVEQDRETASCGRPRYPGRSAPASRLPRRSSCRRARSARSARRTCRARPDGRRRSPSSAGWLPPRTGRTSGPRTPARPTSPCSRRSARPCSRPVRRSGSSVGAGFPFSLAISEAARSISPRSMSSLSEVSVSSRRCWATSGPP